MIFRCYETNFSSKKLQEVYLYNQMFELFNPTSIICRIREAATDEFRWVFLQHTTGKMKMK